MHKVRYSDYYHPSRLDPAFYTWDTPEWVATVEYEDRLLEAWVVGEMRIQLDNDEIIRYTDDLIRAGIDTDEKLFKLNSDSWINNSWIELRDYEGEWVGDVLSGHVYHDVFEAVENMKVLLIDPEFLSVSPCENPNYVLESTQQ